MHHPDPLTVEESFELDLGGMTCTACAVAIERKLNRLQGVNASVNYATERALVTGLPVADASEAIAAVERAGYTAAVHDPEDDEWSRRAAAVRLSSLRRRLTVSALLTIPLCDLTILLALVPDYRFPGWEIVCVLLAVPIVTWAAWPFHKATLRNLRYGSLSMDTLISLGAAVSFLWAIGAMIFAPSESPGFWLGFGRTPAGAQSIYLDVAAGMITFQLAGRYFETRSRRRAGDVLNAIASLAVKDARILAEDGTERIVPIGELRPGQLFVVKPGEVVAADGIVDDGRSTIDASAMTGESLPVEVGPASPVTGGTLNSSGRLVVAAQHVGANTKVAQMAALADAAQRRKAGVQRFVDRVSAVFVPVVIGLALIVGVVWALAGATPGQAVSNAIAVLIIACPCALGLATPTALMVGVGRGGQLGILIKGQDALEASGRIDTVVFDKTGTITTGTMQVDSVHTVAGWHQTEVLPMVAAVETGSEHVIAKAIMAALNPESPAPAATGFRALPGLGARALVQGRDVIVGNKALMASSGLPVPSVLEDAAVSSAHTASGNSTQVFAAVDGAVIAVIRVRDEIKPSAAPAVTLLKQMGLKTVLLTGDTAAAAQTVGNAVGVDAVIDEVLPEQKAARIEQLQAEGRRVAMVGDGINDSAALATANLGLAVVTGTDIAMKSADIILVRDDLRTVVDAIRLSRKTLGTIRMNLVWAFGYNIAAIPLAAFGLLNPLIAAAAMALSSVFVVSNSLRLRSFEPTN
ncbi:copper-translocating P-type ATPase [Humibacter ginsenosidimutans]|uniref:Copper-translocating P-type ATPase n=2 Tax=Humibacter ginsenosidimutans TaxID=2599293 RepID=A0A5B8M7A3_9MICO|nr:copper-translocating P-type ATPase [Humibacter ginsenosidimutans]